MNLEEENTDVPKFATPPQKKPTLTSDRKRERLSGLCEILQIRKEVNKHLVIIISGAHHDWSMKLLFHPFSC